MAARFRTNSPSVVHEVVDGQAIVVNLDSGSYFDLNRSGTQVLAALDAGHDTDAVASGLEQAFGAAPDDAQRDVAAFVAELEGEGLIVPLSGDAPGASANGAPPAPGGPYEAPALNKHTDMQELLLLDPVHEVDDTGWPSRAAAGSGG